MVVNSKESKIIFSAVDRVTAVTNSIAKGMHPLQKKLDGLSKGFKNFGTGAMTKGMVGLGGIALGLVKPAMDFEKSMAQVYKVFDPTRLGVSENNFSKMTVSMAREMGIMSSQMADIFENMPMVELTNIEGVSEEKRYKSIVDMAKMVSMAVTTMSLNASDAGEKIKVLYNVMGGGESKKALDVMNAVNEIGNQYGIAPSKTLEFLKMGGMATGITSGMTGLESSATGASLIGLGATPETARTSFQKLANVGLSYTSATKKQQESFKELGTSAIDFAKEWQKAPTEAIVGLLEKAKGLKGIELTSVFKNLFGVEGAQNLKSLMLNIPKFQKILKTATDEKSIANSVEKEFIRLSKTSSFAYDKMKSSINSVAITLGANLLPHVTKITDKISDLAKRYDKLSQETKDFIGQSVIGTTAMLAFGVAIGGVSYAIGGLLSGLRLLSMAGGGLAIAGALPFKGLSELVGKVPKPSTRTNDLSIIPDGFGGKAANNNRKLSFFGKLNVIIDKIGNSKAINNITKLLTSMGLVGLVGFTASLGAIAASLGFIAISGMAVYTRFKEIKSALVDFGDSFKALFGGGKGISEIKNFGWAISEYIGDALVFIINRLTDAIRGFTFMKNLSSGMGFAKAADLTNYQMAMSLPSERAEFEKDIIPSGNKKLDKERLETLIGLKYNQLPANIENKVTVINNQDGTTTVNTHTIDKKTGSTIQESMRQDINPIMRGSFLKNGGF